MTHTCTRRRFLAAAAAAAAMIRSRPTAAVEPWQPRWIGSEDVAVPSSRRARKAMPL
jgi:hypothetical protein